MCKLYSYAPFFKWWIRKLFLYYIWVKMICTCIETMGWGLGPKVVHWLYVTIIWPTISYASLLWQPRCQTASTKNKLSKEQRLGCLGIIGAYYTTPTGPMEVLVGLPPLDLVIQGEARSAAHHLWSLGCWFTFTPDKDTHAYWLGFRSRIPFLTWGSTLWGQSTL